MRATLLAVLTSLSTLWSLPAAGGELPSPDAMALGARTVPRPLVEGFRKGVEDDAVARVAAEVLPSERVAYRARAHAAIVPILDEAFPTELLAGIGAEFYAARYTAEELQALRAREESPLGGKLQALAQAEADVVADTPEAHARAREKLERKMLSAGERKETEAFAATPLGRKVMDLSPDLAGHFVNALEAHWKSVRASYEPRLRAAAQASRR